LDEVLCLAIIPKDSSADAAYLPRITPKQQTKSFIITGCESRQQNPVGRLRWLYSLRTNRRLLAFYLRNGKCGKISRSTS
jgi:hypothetical protein